MGFNTNANLINCTFSGFTQRAITINFGNPVVLNGVTVSNNSDLYEIMSISYATVTIIDSNIYENAAQFALRVYSSEVHIINSNIQNDPEGSLTIQSSTVVIENSTVGAIDCTSSTVDLTKAISWGSLQGSCAYLGKNKT